jgi:hypothetical protein
MAGDAEAVMSGRTKSARCASSPSKEPELPPTDPSRGERSSRGSAQQKQKSQKAKSPSFITPSETEVPAGFRTQQKGDMMAEGGIGKAKAGPNLSSYREQLVREISGRDAHSPTSKRPSPITEESSFSPPPGIDMDLPTTTSTESGNTIRGGE